MILELLKAIILEPWKFGYMSLVVVWLILTDHKKGHCFGVQKKEPSRDEVSARRCKTCLELASLVLVDQDVHFQNQVVSMSLGLTFPKKKEVKRCWAAAAMCDDKQGVELYRATFAIEKKEPHHCLNLPHNANVVWKVQNNFGAWRQPF